MEINDFISSYEYRKTMQNPKLTEEERKKCIENVEKNNKKIYQVAKKELEETKKQQRKLDTMNSATANQEKDNDNIENVLETEETTDYSFYWDLLQSCLDISELPHYLPKRKNEEFQNIMNALILMCLRSKKEANDFICSEEMAEEEKQFFKEEVDFYQNRAKYLIIYRDTVPTKVELETEEKQNRLVYLRTNADKPCVLTDLKYISSGYEESFQELIDSIKDGSFKGLKTFAGNSKLAGLIEVKNFKTRIVFRRLTKDIYIIFSMFMKDQDNDLKYRESIVKRYEHWHQVETKFKERIKEEAFLLENDEITAIVEGYLAGKEVDLDGGFTREITRIIKLKKMK